MKRTDLLTVPNAATGISTSAEKRRTEMGFWELFAIGFLIGFFITYRKDDKA